METIKMSIKERRRLEQLVLVVKTLQSLKETAIKLGISYRQMKRIWRRYQEQGDHGLVHQSRGRASNRGWAVADREKVLRLYIEHSNGFGPVLASEHLMKDAGLKLDHETLRRW